MKSVEGIDLFMGPKVLGAPDELEQAIVDFVGGATKKLAIAVQELDSEAIAKAIVAAKARKVQVRVILEGDYLVEDPPLTDPWADTGANETNRKLHSALLRAGVSLITDLNPAIFHQKFIVRDPTDANTAAVLTGSANFTLTDTGANPPHNPDKPGNNLNHIIILAGKDVCADFMVEFERLRSGTFGDLHERREPRPREFKIGAIRVKPLFSPEHAPEMEIMKQMLKAKETIDFAMFTFAQSSGIDDTMIRLAPTLQRLRGVLDRGQGNQTWAATKGLTAGGIELFENRTGVGVRKVHHKLMVIDSQLLIIGSFNYTAPANTLNDENIVVIGDLEEKDPAARKAQGKLAKFALGEIERIIADLAEPL